MQINTLSIRNFRGVAAFFAADLDPRVLLIGYNGAGKTTILHAMIAVLDGRVRYRDGAMATIGKRSVNVAELIGPAGDNAVVTLNATHDGHTLDATLRLSKKSPVLALIVDGNPCVATDPDVARSIAYAKMGLNWPRLACGLQPAAYLIGGGVASMIAELGGGLDRAALDALTVDHAEWLTAFAAAQHSDLDSLDALAAIGDAAYTRRTAVNKEIKDTAAEIEKYGFIPAPLDKAGHPLTPAHRPAIFQQIARLRNERDDLLTERGRIETARTREQIDADIATAQRAVDAAQTGLEAANATLQVNIVTAQTALDAANARAAESVDIATSLRNSHAAACEATRAAMIADSTAVAAEHRAENDLSGFKGVAAPEAGTCCPACRQKITPKAREAFTEWAAAQVTEAQSRLDAAIAHRATTLAALTPTREAESCAKSECDDAIRRSETAANAVRDARDALRIAQGAKALDEAAAHRRATEALTTLQAEQPASRTIAAVNAAIAELEARIAKASDAHDALNRIAELDGMNVRRAELDEELAHLNWAIAGFRDGVITRQLTSGEQERFTDSVNAALGPFGYQIAIEGDAKHPRVLFGSLEPDATGMIALVPLAQVSNGEYLLAQWAVTAAFGGGLTFLDSIEQVDGLNKPVLFDALRLAQGGVWMTAANSKPTDPDAVAAGAALGCRVIVVSEPVAEVAA